MMGEGGRQRKIAPSVSFIDFAQQIFIRIYFFDRSTVLRAGEEKVTHSGSLDGGGGGRQLCRQVVTTECIK